jgi:PAS domain S-box-containing protein
MKPSKPAQRTGKENPAPADPSASRFAQEPYPNAFLSAPDAITVSELETGRFIEVNDAVSQIFGFSREELIGKSAAELGIWPEKEDREKFTEQLGTRGRVKQYETVGRRKSGELITVSITADTLIIGTTRYLIAVIRDITDRKLTERALKESEERFYQVAENAGVWIWEVDENGLYSYASPVVERMLGYAPEELVGKKHFYDLFAPDVREELKNAALAAFGRRETIRNFVNPNVHKNGSRVVLETNGAPIIDDAGRFRGYRGTDMDITERKRAEEEIRESESRYSALFTNNYSVSLLIDPDTGRITDANEAAGRYYGYSHDQLTTMGIYDLNRLPEETVVRNLRRARREKERHFFSTHYRADGEKRNVEIYSGPITVQGKPLFYSIIHDVTDRKKAETELQKSQYLISEAMNMAHMADWEMDVPTSVFTFNDRFYALYGTTAEREGGYQMPAEVYAREFVHPDDRHMVGEEIARALSAPGSGYYSLREHRIIRRDGEVRYIIVRIRITKDAEGRTIRTHGANQDITERKLGEEALRESEAKFRTLFEGASDAIFIMNRTTFLDCNHSTEVIYGCSRDQIIGHSPVEFSPERQPDGQLSAEKVRDKIDAALKGEPQTFEWVHVRFDRTPFNAEVTLSRIFLKGEYCLQSIVRDITERKRAEEQLKESESRYSALFTNNYSVSLLIDPDTGRITDANEAAERYYGYSHDQLTGMGIYDLNRLPEETVVRNLRRARGEKERHFFSNHYRADGEKRNVEIYSGPITVQGKLLFYSIIHDITERKTAEEALRHSEATLKVILQSSPIPKFVIDNNHRVIFWNTSLEETTGIKAQDVIGTDQHWRAFYPAAHPCIADLLVDRAEEILSGLPTGKYKKSEVMEGAFEMTDFFPNLGESGRWLRAIAAPIIDSKGKVIGAVETLEDITRLTKAQQSLMESEERYRTLVDQLPDYVLVHRNGVLLYINPAAASRLGYTAENLIGKPILPLIAPEYHAAVSEAIALRMAGREVPSYEMKIRAMDGSYRTVITNGSIINYEGRPASLNVLSDITDRKLMEEEVRSLNRVLEQRVQDRTEALSRANEQLTAEVAARAHADQEIVRSLQEKDLLLREIHHRVKNNLQIIASLLNLQSRTITDPNVLEAIKSSQSRIRAMALVHERIYRSHDIAEINLKDYLTYLTKQIFQFYNIQQHQIGIEVTMDGIMADIDTITPLGLVMNELVSNSLKYAFPDGRKGTISIACSPQDGNMLRIVYHDDGIGMPPGFDWKKSESLGLQLVTSLVDQLNGTIERGEGEGTTFIITIQQKRDSSSS